MVMRQVKIGHTTWHNLNVFSQNHIKMPYERPSDSDMGMVYLTVSKGLTIRQTYFVEAVITTGCLIARYHLTYFTSNWMYKAWKVFFRYTSTGRWSLKIVNHMSNVFQSNLLDFAHWFECTQSERFFLCYTLTRCSRIPQLPTMDVFG